MAGYKRPIKATAVKNSIREDFAKAEQQGRPGTVGNLIGGILNAGLATVGAIAGYKAAGPVGAGGGILAGSAVVETAKHYATAGAGAMMNRRGSGGSSGGGDASVEGLRSAVAAVADDLVTSTSSAIMSAIQVIEESLGRFEAVSDGSSDYAVDEAKAGFNQALTACDEARSSYNTAAETARSWAAGI